MKTISFTQYARICLGSMLTILRLLFFPTGRKLICLLFCFMTINGLRAQHANIFISDNSNPEEPTIFIDPSNPDHILAGANISRYYHSHDGGFSWAEGSLYSTYGAAGDPCVIVDTAGTAFIFHLSSPSQGYWLDRIVCQKSVDHGQSWSNGSYMGHNPSAQQDKEWAVVDPATNNIYVSWTQFDSYGSHDPADRTNIMFSRSLDEGQSWMPAIQINMVSGDCIDSDNTVEGAVPCVGPEGQVYVSWAGPEGIVFDRSLDGGLSWLEEDIFVDEMPGGWDMTIPGISRANGLPVTRCDLSTGPYRGNVYINWADQRNGPEDTDIWIAKSTDGGNTWSAPFRVNDDDAGNQQFFTWMDVDAVTGYIWIVFYDRRNYNDLNTDVFMAVSKDGGDSFQNFKISESPFAPYSSVFFGDYTNVSAVNNVVRPIWTRLDQDGLSIWTAIVDTEVVGLDYEESIPFALEQNYPNPFSESTWFKFKIREAGVSSLIVYDVFGNKLFSIFENKFFLPGKYVEHFNPGAYGLTPACYYFRFCSANECSQKKMLYVR